MTWRIIIEHTDDATKETYAVATMVTDSEVNHSYGDILGYYFKRELATVMAALKEKKS